jgi:hypothetical protein
MPSSPTLSSAREEGEIFILWGAEISAWRIGMTIVLGNRHLVVWHLNLRHFSRSDICYSVMMDFDSSGEVAEWSKAADC